jgi:rubredoxin
MEMDKWECSVCGYIYDPELGDPEHNIPPQTPFEQLPENWACPVCGAPKSQFVKRQ